MTVGDHIPPNRLVFGSNSRAKAVAGVQKVLETATGKAVKVKPTGQRHKQQIPVLAAHADHAKLTY